MIDTFRLNSSLTACQQHVLLEEPTKQSSIHSSSVKEPSLPKSAGEYISVYIYFYIYNLLYISESTDFSTMVSALQDANSYDLPLLITLQSESSLPTLIVETTDSVKLPADSIQSGKRKYT